MGSRIVLLGSARVAMTKHIGSGIVALYPASRPQIDWAFMDYSDGRGPQVTRWDEAVLGPMPDLAQLETAGIAAEAAVAAERAVAKDVRQQVMAVLSALDAGTATLAEVQQVLAYVVRNLISQTVR